VKGGLTTEAFREYVGFIVEETTNFLSGKWKDSGIADIQPIFASLTIMTASRCLMGKEIRKKLDESGSHGFLC
jgi:sterol 14-demethylase